MSWWDLILGHTNFQRKEQDRGERGNGGLLVLMASLLHTRSPSCSRPSLPSPTFPIFRSSQHPRHWSPQILHHHHCATFGHWGQVSNGPNKSVQQKQPAQKHERGHTREAPALQGAEDAGLLLIDQSEKSADTVQGPAPPGKGSPLAATTLQRSALNLQKQIMNFALWQDHRPLRCQPDLHCLAWSKRGTAQESRELIFRDTGRRQKREVIHTQEVSVIKQVLQHCLYIIQCVYMRK